MSALLLVACVFAFGIGSSFMPCGLYIKTSCSLANYETYEKGHEGRLSKPPQDVCRKSSSVWKGWTCNFPKRTSEHSYKIAGVAGPARCGHLGLLSAVPGQHCAFQAQADLVCRNQKGRRLGRPPHAYCSGELPPRIKCRFTFECEKSCQKRHFEFHRRICEATLPLEIVVCWQLKH